MDLDSKASKTAPAGPDAVRPPPAGSAAAAQQKTQQAAAAAAPPAGLLAAVNGAAAAQQKAQKPNKPPVMPGTVNPTASQAEVKEVTQKADVLMKGFQAMVDKDFMEFGNVTVGNVDLVSQPKAA